MATTPKRSDVEEIVGALLPAGARATLVPRLREGRPPCAWDVVLSAGEPIPGATVQRIRNGLDRLRTLHTFEVVDAARLDPAVRRREPAAATRLA